MTNAKKTFLRLVVFPAAFALLATGAGAEEPELDVTDYGKQVPSTEDLVNALDPALGVKTRSLSDSGAAKMRSVSLGIQFERDSHELSDSARDVLDRLGGALSSPQLSEHEFMIEGHTDAIGSNDYNQSLSEKRAVSVKNYLVNVFGIEPTRLQEVGRGETALLNDSDPGGEANRRVQIINMGQ